jgi:hypothetical protein
MRLGVGVGAGGDKGTLRVSVVALWSALCEVGAEGSGITEVGAVGSTLSSMGVSCCAFSEVGASCSSPSSPPC